MPIMRVRGAGKLGVIKDLPSFELPPEAWTDAQNVRFRYGSIEKMGGYEPVLTDPSNGAPLSIVQRSNMDSIIYGTSDSIMIVEGSSHRKVNARTFNEEGEETGFETYSASPESTWYYTTLSNSIVMNTPLNDPQGMRPFDSYFIKLPGWGEPQGPDVEKPDPDKPDGPPIITPSKKVDWKAGRIRAYRNYLVALDMVEGGISLPQRVRWSNVSYVNDLPPDWTENDETKDGGFNDLSDANGKVVDGCPLRDTFVVYTDQETYLMDYVGGILIFNFRKLFSDSGLLAPECVAEFEGKHFVIAQNDIFVHNGSSRQPVASGRLKEFLINEISSVNPYATKVTPIPSSKEIWVSYVAPGSPADSYACNKAAIWNWEYDTWSFYELPDLYDLNMALPQDPDAREWEDYGEVDRDEWDSAVQEEVRWSEYGKDFINRVLYGASSHKTLYLLDEGETLKSYASGVTVESPLVAVLERTHLDMDEVVESTRVYKLIKNIVPQFRGEGNISVFVGGSMNATSPPDWSDYSIFDIEEDVKVDCFSNNRYPSIKFIDYGLGTWYLTGYDINFVQEGNR